MTPLAHAILKRRTLPLKKRTPYGDPESLLGELQDFHCFEMTEVLDLYRFHLQKQVHDIFYNKDYSELQKLIFLPAERVWLETKYPWEDVGRQAYFLIEDGEYIRATSFSQSGCGSIGRIPKAMPFSILPSYHEQDAKTGKFYAQGHLTQIVCYLLMINSPRIIGRCQHMPNRALERRLSQKLGAGKFPLHAWTEIKLQVTKPLEIDDGEPHEAHLTGKRALHFCRAHIRIRLGRLEFVTSHWRGDPAIGIKQSRYVVAP